MKKFVLLTLLCLLNFKAELFAQDDAPMVANPITIQEEGIFKKKVYSKCDIELTKPQLMTLLVQDPNLSQFKGGLIFHYVMGTLFSTAATILITWPIYQELDNSRDETNWNLAYIGAGCLVASIPFNIAFNNKAKKAVDYYNAGYQNPTSYNFKLNFSGTNIGLVMNF